MNINKVIVPTSTGDGQGRLNYYDGKLVSYEHGSVVNVYLFHEQDGEDVRALEVTIQAPLTFDKCVNGAEMAAYGLSNALDVASFGASLARKARNNESLDEVREHDLFIAQVKLELCRIGLGDGVDLLDIAKSQKIAELEDYDTSDSVNSFEVVKDGQRITDWIEPDKRSNYRGSLEDCVLLGVTDIEVPIGGMLIPMTVADARVKLAQVQLYADRCAMVTEAHRAAILALSSVEAVEAYDFTVGYPERLSFDVADMQ